jgi:hypothetical protein
MIREEKIAGAVLGEQAAFIRLHSFYSMINLKSPRITRINANGGGVFRTSRIFPCFPNFPWLSVARN